jgi:hypothetical protein
MEARGHDMRRHRMFADAMGPRGHMGPMGEGPMGPPPPDGPQDR